MLAGIATDVGVTLTALGAIRLGYTVFVAVDLCAAVSERAEIGAWSRLTQAGATLLSWPALIAELQGDYTVGVGPELIQLVNQNAH